MNLCVRLVTQPPPGPCSRIVILIIIVAAVLVATHTGYGAQVAVALTLATGLTGAQVARALLAIPGGPQ